MRMSAPVSAPDGPVLVAVDFSEDSRVALAWAARQAELEDRALVVLHVVHDPAASPGFYRETDETWLRAMNDVAEEMMESFLAELTLEHPELAALRVARSRLVSGLPAGRINEVARETGAHLVVLGSRGRTGLDSILLGSVAERVAQICSVPVVIVKAPSPESSK